MNNWVRVTSDHPCPICGKPTWCMVSADETAVICPRTESDHDLGEAGYVHRFTTSEKQKKLRRTVPIKLLDSPIAIEWDSFAKMYQAAVSQEQLQAMAIGLGVSPESLHRLGIGWSSQHGGWCFPMKDEKAAIIGIRLRSEERKWAVPGSRAGLFLPNDFPGNYERLLICEGATDLAALLDLGYTATVGRPSCTGGVKLLTRFTQSHRPKEVIVIADGDPPGVRGANMLAAELALHCKTVKIAIPPAGVKDVRAWKQSGVTNSQLEAVFTAAITCHVQNKSGGTTNVR